ncbi:MAG: hypothetical protein Kow0068_22220 [Marinilabiliales bacterium]
MKKIFLITICVLLLSSFVDAQITKYRKINEKGIANMVFSNKAIPKGQESSVTLKNSFSSGEAIYARCYFPKPFGQYNVSSNEDFFIDLYLDGKFVERKKMLHPDADWDQISLYVLNTGDDDFKNLEIALNNAGSGTHTLQVSVGFEKYNTTKKVVNSDGTIENKDVFNAVYISDGKIEINVK